MHFSKVTRTNKLHECGNQRNWASKTRFLLDFSPFGRPLAKGNTRSRVDGRCAVARGASPTEKATMCSLPSWIAWPLPSNAFLRLHFPPRLFFLQREAVLTVAVLKDWRRSVNRNGSKVLAGIYFFVRFYVKYVNIDSKFYDFFPSFLFVSIFYDRKKNYRIATILLMWNLLDVKVKILDDIINFFFIYYSSYYRDYWTWFLSFQLKINTNSLVTIDNWLLDNYYK